MSRGTPQRASEIARERLDELNRVAADPATDPAVAEQARTDAAILEHGLSVVRAALDEKQAHARQRQARAEFVATAKAYRAWQARPGNRDGRPTQEQVAAERRMGERTLAEKLRAIGIEDWHDVHALIEAVD